MSRAQAQKEKINEIKYVIEKRPNGTLRYALDFSNCPTMAEQHTAHLSDINYLMEKYKPDELAAYMAARASRPEIVGHDFSQEPNMQEGMNITLQLRKNFEALPEELRVQFKNHVEFLKFIDNPANVEKIIRLGLATKQEIDKNLPPQTPTKSVSDEEKDTKGGSTQSSSTKKQLDEK